MNNFDSNTSSSVLQSVYDGDDSCHFRDSLKSLVVSKEYFDRLVLVVDGPIKKELSNVITEYSEHLKIDILWLKNNKGLPNALNQGLRHIGKGIVFRFDSDDISDPDRFSDQLRFIQNHGLKKKFVIGSSIEEFNDIPGDLKKFRSPPLKKNVKSFFFNPINHMTACYKCEDILEIGGYPDIPGFEDFALWDMCIKNNFKIFNMPKVLVYARVGNNFNARRSGISYIKREIKFGFYRLQLRPNYFIIIFFSILLRVSGHLINGIFNGFLTKFFLRK